MASDKSSPPKRVGRPPRVTAADIAEAALEIGLERATIRGVAERLGMSVQGLYHHVSSREELLAMAAAHGLSDLPLPDDHGQPWPEWVLEYSRYVYDALVAQPHLIGAILAGTVNTTRMAQHLEQFFTVLGERGIGVAEAYELYGLVLSAVNGAALAEVSRRTIAAEGHARLDDLRRAARALGPEATPQVRDLLALPSPPEWDPFTAVRLVVRALEAPG